MRGLKSKVAIVTGGGGGIGRAICCRLGEEGVTVGVFDRVAHTAADTVRAMQETGGRGVAVTVDITDYHAVKHAVTEFEQEFGSTDILVNNAGWDRLANFLDTEPSFWNEVISINLLGPLNLHHIVVRGMSERSRGRVINIASDAGRVGSSGEAVYSACKGGIISFTKTLARELASQHINVNAVCPGPTDTALLQEIRDSSEVGYKIYEGLKRAIPFRRLGCPEDIAGIVVFLASDEASFITGQVISVSGGLSMSG